MDYLQDLWKTFSENPLKILCTAFLIWAILPLIALAFGGGLLLLRLISLEGFTILWLNALLPWWTAIIISFKKFILEYFLVSVLTLILVNHDLIKTINFKELIKFIKKNN